MNEMTIKRRTPAVDASFDADVPPLLRRIYAARGVGSSEELNLSIDRLLPVSSLDGVQAAAELLARHRQGRVLIVGDYDADGATSTALLLRALRQLEFAHVEYVVPDRFRFGYGLSAAVVDAAAPRRPTLLVTVDNGVASIDGVRHAASLGIPVLVTDHHLPGDTLPAAAAIVNPNLPGARFASRALAGVGVAFYLVVALTHHLRASFRPVQLLDLVALGTVADLVPLDRNNRILVHQGLRRIRAGHCAAGIRALLELAHRPLAAAHAADLSFAVAPRINAAGRLTDMSLGIECLVHDGAADAMHCALQLSQLNEERRAIEARMQEQAERLVAAKSGSWLLAEHWKSHCLFDAEWHEGVIGLIAGRTKDRTHRPVMAFAPAADGTLRGSARSIPGVHIRDALASIDVANPGLLLRFGGHAMAAGATVAHAELARFRDAFEREMAQRVDEAAMARCIHSDGSLQHDELNLVTARLLRDAGPWGQGFPEPVFDGHFEVIDCAWLKDRHLKLRLRGAAGEWVECIRFRAGESARAMDYCAGATVEVAYRLEVNSFNGTERAQMNAAEIRLVESRLV